MKARYILFLVAALTLAACSKTNEQPEPEGIQMTFRAYQEGAQETKTTVQDGGTQVYWEPSDEIKVFFKSSSGRFVSQNTELAGVADFSGTLNILVGANEGFDASNQTWGLYPYRADAAYDGEYVSTTLPASQTGKAGSFATNTHICLARSGGNDLAFYNVTGGLRFSLTHEGIDSVRFEGINCETIAGSVKLTFSEGIPIVQQVLESETVITLTAPNGSFSTGEWYYIEALPATLSGGFRMSFYKANESAELISSKSVTIKRGVYGSIANADAGLTFGSDNTENGYEYVDLGLPSGLKWATCNVGATKPEEYGDYFAWGETEPKSATNTSTMYKWYNGYYNKITKYCAKSSYWDGSGQMDNKTVLDLEDDAAHVNWGGNWRMPTDKECAELIDNCTWTWTSDYNGTGIAGRIGTASNGNSIFLPAAGCWHFDDIYLAGSSGGCWSSSLYPAYSAEAWYVNSFYSVDITLGTGSRDDGQSIRPVYGNFISVSSIHLNESELELNNGESAQLCATVSPSNASAPDVRWVSDNKGVVSVNQEGNLTTNSVGTATITVYSSNGLNASCVVKVLSTPKAVDLGLSVKWASFNLGATRPEEYGEYFAWGETMPKTDYSWSTYKWCNGDKNKLTKYCPSDKADFWDGSGSPDNKTVLDLEDDAAHVILGGSWRLPTEADWRELWNNCTCTMTSVWYNGVTIYGQLVEASNGNSIFLPEAGEYDGTDLKHAGSGGSYWFSSISPSYPFGAFLYTFSSDMSINHRYYGVSIRPVSPKD